MISAVSVNELNTQPIPLYTDYYELNMAYGYWKNGMKDRRALFYLSFRDNPFGGGYVISAGQRILQSFLSNYHFDSEALQFLSAMKVGCGGPRFEEGFLRYLSELRLDCEISAVEEGRMVFPYEPILCVEGSIIQCQLLEGLLLNVIGFHSLIATKASRICKAAYPAEVMEFGLRRAHGLQAACWSSWAAYIGGVGSTSNVAAGRAYGIPLNGTHAHSWVMSFAEEQEAFERYADLMPHDCVLLVDTYHGLRGIMRAIHVGQKMAEKGRKLRAIRIDSGDLAAFSRDARRYLDQAGLWDVKVLASGNLDEHSIASLREQNAPIDGWGIGTQLSTSFSQPSLGLVYKLAALQDETGAWLPKLKISNSPAKMSIPGRLSVLRFRNNGVDSDNYYVADMVYDRIHDLLPPYRTFQTGDAEGYLSLDPNSAELEQEELLYPLVYGEGVSLPSMEDALLDARGRARADFWQFQPSIFNLNDPQTYYVGLELGLHDRRYVLCSTL